MPNVAGQWVLRFPVAGGGQGPFAEVARSRSCLAEPDCESNARVAIELCLTGNRAMPMWLATELLSFLEPAGGGAPCRSAAVWRWSFLLCTPLRGYDWDKRAVARGSTGKCAEQATKSNEFRTRTSNECNEFRTEEKPPAQRNQARNATYFGLALQEVTPMSVHSVTATGSRAAHPHERCGRLVHLYKVELLIASRCFWGTEDPIAFPIVSISSACNFPLCPVHF